MFYVTAEQVNQPDAQLRIDYDMTDAVRVGLPPTEVEMILRTVGTGIVIGQQPVHDRHADMLTFDISSLAADTALRWAIIVKTKGWYHGTLEISNVRFHSSDGAADPFIRRVASKLVNALSSVVTDLAARVAALESGGVSGPARTRFTLGNPTSAVRNRVTPTSAQFRDAGFAPGNWIEVSYYSASSRVSGNRFGGLAATTGVFQVGAWDGGENRLTMLVDDEFNRAIAHQITITVMEGDNDGTNNITGEWNDNDQIIITKHVAPTVTDIDVG